MAHGEEVEDDDNVYGDYQRPEKRARLGEKIFPKATIMKIKVHDFMTYAGTVTITPGPGLNLVLGPNGTGKSSLVCAMCVGLGGSTKLLGRADDLREYIRRGKTSAWTEITLSGGPTERDHVVRRDIKFETNSEGRPVCHSLWKINGNPRTHKAVTELMKVNNVQLDNLCQFLPQDKVVEFARLNPQQLLEETEKAIGDAELHRLHMHLVETKVSFDSEKERRDNNDRTLQRTMQEHERQQNEYQRFFQRKTLQKEIDTLQAKILWLEYAESQRRFAESKLKLSKGKELLATRKSELKEDTRPIQMLEGRVRQLKAEREAASRELSALKRDVANKASMADATKADLDKAIGEKASLKEQSKLRLKKLEGLQTAVSQLEAEIAAAPSAAPAEMTDRLVELYAQTQEADQRCQTINEEQIAISHERNDLERRVQELEKKLEAMNNVKIQRLKVMERKKHGIAQVWKWVQDNKGRFKGEVLGPIGLEISATREFAGFLETHIGGTLNHFVTSCREDEEILSGWLKDNQNVLHNNFTVTTYGADPNAPVRHPLGNASHYQHLGVLHTLDEVFTTDHQVIKHVLCNMTGIDKVYVASPNSSVEDILNAMPKPVAGKGLQMTVYMGTSKFSNTISAYNPIGKSYAQNEVRPADVLTGALPSDAESERAQLQAEKKQLEAQRRSADERRAAGEQQAKAAEQRRDGLYVQCQKLSEQIEKIKRKRGELTRLLNVKNTLLATEQAKPDPLDKAGELNNRISKLAAKMANESKEGCKLLSLVWEKMQASAARDLSLKEAEMQMSALTDAAKRRREAVELAEKAVAQLEAIVATERRECEAAKAKRDAEAPETPELLATVKAPPTDVEAVKELIREKEQELDQIVCTNPNIMREYQQRHTTIEGLQKTVSEADAVLASMQADMSATREKWLPELMKIVETINTSFSANFAEIGCAGEVVLHEASIAAEKYKECALEIRVQFRETESLEVLNIHRQSGGERSVSTVLFLIALQGVTVTPFRVIDEINQGMDPINERKVFTQLVASACRPDTPQCFLLTPKLLPGLHFTPDITILQIMNGPHIHTNLPEKFANAAVAMYGRRAAALVA